MDCIKPGRIKPTIPFLWMPGDNIDSTGKKRDLEVYKGPNAKKEEKLAGVAIYGYPVGARAAGSISDELEPKQALELTRLFIHEEYGKNMESISISKTFKWLKTNAPDIKVLISYADPGQEHIGGIYQATNWMYQGYNLGIMDNYGIKLETDGKWIHSRTVYEMFGSGNLEHLKSRIGHTFWRRKEPRKHRFFY